MMPPRLAILPALLLVAAHVAAQPVNPIRSRFQSQIDRSIDRSFSYRKTVAGADAASADAGTGATIRYQVKNKPGTKDNGIADRSAPPIQFADELAYATELLYSDPALVAYFDTTRSGDTLVAVLKPNLEAKCDLRRQKIVRDASTGVIRYIASTIERQSWLYDTHVYIEVQFRPDGLYDLHRLTFGTDILFLPDEGRTRVIGQADYAAR